MLVMGIDTSTEIGALGLIDDSGLLAEMNISLANRHSQSLLANIDYLLRESKLTVHDLEGISVTIGPGSYTGLRIGITTVKTLVQVLDIKIIALSSLDVLAYSLSHLQGYLLPLIDAKRERVYTALYHGWQEDIKKSKKWQEKALSVQNLLNNLSEFKQEEKYYLIGNGISAYQDIFLQADLNLSLAPANLNILRGGAVAQLGYYYLKQGLATDLYKLLPNYLKKAQAELNWQKKKKME